MKYYYLKFRKEENLNHTLQVFAEMLRRRQNRAQCADDALIVVVTDWNAVSF